MSMQFSHIFTSTIFFILISPYNRNTFVSCANAKPNVVILFSDHYHQGKKTAVNISKCYNLLTETVGTVTAVDTNGLCARFYADKDCTGKSIEMTARSPSHHNLGDWNFNDLIVSAGPCREDCNINVTGPLPSKYGVNVSIFDRSKYQGATEVINVRGCTIIPRKFNYRVLSINTTLNENCFQLYNNVKCRTDLTHGFDSIELRKGTPFHDEINRWLLHQVKAISHCSYKCDKNHSQNAPPSSLVQPENENEVILYDEPKFTGNLLRLDVGLKNCVNLDQYNGWEGATQSIKVFPNTTSCIVLYSYSNCSGYFTLKLNASLDDLTKGNFSSVTRSFIRVENNCEDISNVDEIKAASSSQVSKSKFRLGSIFLVVVSMIAGVLLLLLVVGKWWYPNMSLQRIFLLCRRNEIGSTNWSTMRL